MCGKVREKYPTSTIIFITPHYQTKYLHDKGVTSYEISKAIKEVCERYAITVFDNYSINEMFKENLEIYTTDACHWNDKAHEMVGKNLAKFVLNTFTTPTTYTKIINTDWIGKVVTVDKNYNNSKSFAHLTALVEVDDDIKVGTVITATLKGKDCFNLFSGTNVGGVCYWDTSGKLDNSKYSGTATKGANPNHTITITDDLMEYTVTSREINRESAGAKYIKIPFVISGSSNYGFTITEISVAFDGIEKPIIDLGAFFTHDEEVVNVIDVSLFDIKNEMDNKPLVINSNVIDFNLFDMAGKEYRYTKDITEIKLLVLTTTNKDIVCESCLSFTTGASAPSISVGGVSSFIKWTGTDIVNNTFTPKANTRYTIVFWNDGFIHNAIVRGVNK